MSSEWTINCRVSASTGQGSTTLERKPGSTALDFDKATAQAFESSFRSRVNKSSTAMSAGAVAQQVCTEMNTRKAAGTAHMGVQVGELEAYTEENGDTVAKVEFEVTK